MSIHTFSTQSSCQQLANHYTDDAVDIACKTSFKVAVNTLLAMAFTTVNPVAAAILGGVSGITAPLWRWALAKADLTPTSDIGRITATVFKTLTGTVAGTLTLAALGFSIPLGTAFILNLSAVGLYLAGSHIYNKM